MEITPIEEIQQPRGNQKVMMQKLKGKVCIYYPDLICTAPRLQFKICRTCSRAVEYIRKNVVRSIFEYVKSVAISFLKGMNIQLSK